MLLRKRLMKLTVIAVIAVLTAVLPPALYAAAQASSVLQKAGQANHWVEWVIRLNKGQQLKLAGSCTDASGTGISYIHEFHVDMRQADPGVPSEFPNKYNYIDCLNVNATFTVPQSGMWVYYFHVHTNSTADRYLFNYNISVTDLGGGSSPTPTPTPAPTNRPPVAVNDSLRVAKNGSLSINMNTMLANDSDPDGDTLKIVGGTTTSNGTMTQTSATSAVYRPRTNFVGTDSFTYTISDGRGATAIGTVTITVGP